MNTTLNANTDVNGRKSRRQFFVLVSLLILCVVPVAGGIVRMAQLTGGAEITRANARFFASPWPVMLHIVAIIPYSILGAFQFIPQARRRWPRWHRISGRLLIPSGLLVALTGLWMTLFYPWPEGDGVWLYWMRIVVGSAMILAILMGVVMIRRRNFLGHGAWMIRGYALGMGAGTQVLTHLPWFLLVGGSVAPGELPRALMMGAGWVINIALAEWIIYRRIGLPGKRSTPKMRQLQNVQAMDASARVILLEKRATLSTLWIFVLFNVAFRDIHEIFRSGFLAEIMTGTANGVLLTEELLLVGGLMMEIPIAMVLLARLLPYAANRWANVIAALLTIVAIVGNGVHDLDDIFFTTVQIAALLVIVGIAWRWRSPNLVVAPSSAATTAP